MAAKKSTKRSGAAKAADVVVTHRYCAARFPKPRKLPKGMDPKRARLIRESASKWLNGSTVRYWFFDAPAKWLGPEAQKKVVRDAFKQWKDLGIGLDFVEVSKRSEADLRIAFLDGDGSWSYIGTDVRTKRNDPRTMNFGWDLREDPDTALHEIGHTLGFPHEHQNPFAGIKWNEEAVYAALAEPPNEWTRSETFSNIIEKIAQDTVQGSSWDPDSVMHYSFEKGLILEPAKYRKGITPRGGLSDRDREWIQKFYPRIGAGGPATLLPFQSAALALAPGQQANFLFTPSQTRFHELRTFGSSDTVMAVFDPSNASVPIAEDDDSGQDRNAYVKVKLAAGRKYTVRIRLYYAVSVAKPGPAQRRVERERAAHALADATFDEITKCVGQPNVAFGIATGGIELDAKLHGRAAGDAQRRRAQYARQQIDV
jgi:hypothetical protein